MDSPFTRIEKKKPLWATREFRWLTIVVVLSLSIVAVILFELEPTLRQKEIQKIRGGNPTAYVPPPGPPQDVKYDGILNKVQDRTSIDEQDEPYLTLVRSLGTIDQQALSKQTKQVDYATYFSHTEGLRGETIRITALFLKSNPIRVDKKPGGVEWIHRTYLMDLSGDEGYVVDLLERPPENVKYKSLVAVDAVFLKVGTYEGRNGPVKAPFLLGRGTHVVKEKMAVSAFNIGTLVVGLAVLTVGIAVVLTWRIVRKRRPAKKVSSLELLKTE